jgi:prepilin signal peptidase PulO-like enzyme (type II secretory pathway)
MLRKESEHVIPFGPYLGIAAILIVLFKIDIGFVLDLIVK